MNTDDKVTYFGQTDARNQRVKFGIKDKDRTRHLYVIGKTGMGKSTLLENLAVQDIQNGNGLAFLDPHGKSADLLLEYIPKERINDVIYFAPFDMEHPISFNVMEDVGAERRHLVASGLMSAFKKIWVDAWSARMEYILGNIMLALLEFPGSTLIGVNRMLADKNFRTKVVDNITDPSVKSFWVDEYAKYTDKFAAEAAPAIQNKVGQFVANPLVRNIIGQPKSTFDIRKIMDEKKILIINLSKGRVGESNANLLGSMLITKIYLAAMSRADLNEAQLKQAPQFYLYVDEFQSFANESFADILSEARKYKLNLTIAHQYIEQMSEEVRAAVFGNVGTMITFRVGAYDAEVLEKEFAPQFTATDIVNLQQYQMYLKLMIDSVTSQPFSATGMPPIPKPDVSYVQEIIEASRKNFARTRYEVEDEIRRWHENTFSDIAGQKKSDVKKGGSGVPPHQGLQQKVNQGEHPSSHPKPYNKRHASNQRSTTTPQQAGDSRKEKEKRETDLRKAISLSYLKTEPEVKNDQKTAKPENVAALRDALLSVMKEAKVDTTPMETAWKNPASQPESTASQSQTPHSEKSTPAEKERMNISHQHHSPQQPIVQEARHPEKSSSPLEEQLHSDSRKQQSASSAASATTPVSSSSASLDMNKNSAKPKRSPAEVPEEILKKILDL